MLSQKFSVEYFVAVLLFPYVEDCQCPHQICPRWQYDARFSGGPFFGEGGGASISKFSYGRLAAILNFVIFT